MEIDYNAEIRTEARKIHDTLLGIGDVAFRHAEILRATRKYNGEKEDDAVHSFHLALSANEIATTHFKDRLDAGLVTQFCLVHDLPEIYAGDTPTFLIDDDTREQKEKAEKAAFDRLIAELPPATADLLIRYEKQEEPEARFVRFLDKFMPAVSMALSKHVELFKQENSIERVEDMRRHRAERSARLFELFPEKEFEVLHVVRSLFSDTVEKHVFPHLDDVQAGLNQNLSSGTIEDTNSRQ